jgi:hypothetical protein
MCGLTILPADVCNHPKCHGCSILLEPELNDKTLCWCGKYHNAPSIRDPNFCRMCMGEEVPTGTPRGQPVRIQDDEEDPDEPDELETN